MILADELGFCGTVGLVFVLLLICGLVGIGVEVFKAYEKQKTTLAQAHAVGVQEQQKSAKLQVDVKAVQEEADKRKNELEAEYAQKMDEGKRELEAQRQSDQSALARAVQEVRDSADERYRTALAAKNISELDQRLREAQLIASHGGRVITARVFASPTGWIGIEWMVDPSRPTAPRVECKRDDDVVFVEYAYRGLHAEILPRGREFIYSFTVHDGANYLETDFQFPAEVPTKRQWQREVDAPTPKSTTAERKRRLTKTVKAVIEDEKLVEGARQAGYKIIDDSQDPPRAKQKRKATLDLKLQQEREKEEGGDA